MLDQPPGLARVMRVVGSEEKPPSGFSWGDFEDAGASVQVDDEDGWSSVPTRPRKSTYEHIILWTPLSQSCYHRKYHQRIGAWLRCIYANDCTPQRPTVP
jgi:hypothetical protein